MAAENQTLYDIPAQAKAFGILGNFPGDDLLLKELEWCQETFVVAETDPSQPVADKLLKQLISLVDSLPNPARATLVTKILALSPLRDRLLEQLFDQCVLELPTGEGDESSQDENDDSFVLLLTESTLLLDTRKYHLLQVVLLLLPFCQSETAVKVSQRYLRSASTRYQGNFLSWCAKQSPEIFSNEELWKFYSDSPALVQKEVLNVCKSNRSSNKESSAEAAGVGPAHPREEFIKKVLSETNHDDSLIFWCSSAFLESRLDDSFVGNLGLQRWDSHSSLYLKYMRQKLLAEPSQLARSEIWKRLESGLPAKLANDLKPHHIHQLKQLLQECHASEFQATLPTSVQLHLRTLASGGEDISNYEGVQPLALSYSFLAVIPKKERIQTAVQALEENDWTTFQQYQKFANYADLPFEQAFINASSEDLWCILSGRYKKAKMNSDADKIFQYFATTDFTQNNRRSFTIDALFEWHELHIRAVPTSLTVAQRELYARAAGLDTGEDGLDFLPGLWKLWFQSWKSRFLDNGLVKLTADRVLEATRKHRPQARSKITLDARYAHVLVSIAEQGIQALPADLFETKFLIARLKTVLSLFGQLTYNHLQVVANLNSRMEEVVLGEWMPRMTNMLHFDPTKQKAYISQEVFDEFNMQTNWMAGRIKSDNPSFRPVLKVFMDQVLSAALAKATYQNHHKPQRGTVLPLFEEVSGSGNPANITFVYYDSQLHQRVVQAVIGALTRILQQTKTIDGLQEEHKSAWALVSQFTFADTDFSDPSGLNSYLQKCLQCLSEPLLEAEMPKIMDRVAACAKSVRVGVSDQDKRGFQRKTASVANTLHKLGFLSAAAETSVFTSEEGDALLLQTGAFQYKIVQESLQEQTKGMDGDKRADGHVSWLRSAFADGSLQNIATAVDFCTGRIRNEAGLYRRRVFDFLASQLSQAITKSLDAPGPAAVDKVREIATKLEEMLRNDLDRRDSIGRMGGFKGIPAETIKSVLRHDSSKMPSSPLRAELRQLWISFAVKIHWMQTQSGGGESGLMTYTWQAGHAYTLTASRLIEAEVFDKLYPRSENFMRIAKLKERVDPKDTVVNDLDKRLGPKEFVSCMAKALDEVWDPKFPCGPLSWQGSWCPEDSDIASALLGRLVTLYKVCDISWEEVPLLTETFDLAFDNLPSAPEHHYSFASKLLESILQIYGHAASTFEIARLAGAIDKTFRYAVAKDMKADISNWFYRWCEMIQEQGLRDWGPVDDNVRMKSFLVKFSKGCEPPSCKLVVDKIELSNRKAVVARELLAMSPSAVLETKVQDLLESERQDVVGRMYGVGQQEGKVAGPFAPEGGSNQDKLLYEWLRPSALNNFPPKISLRYAEYALTLASDANVSVAQRVEAIENFVASPSTGHSEVMHALQRDIDSTIREAIIIKVFSLDAPWHVVSFLLNSSLANKEQQRMTATLLGHIKKYIQVDKVVDLLGMLLDVSRRSRLGMQLHKAIIRMLFDNRTPKTTDLLQAEWLGDLPMEIRHVMVQNCIETAATREPQVAEWEWTVLESLAKEDTSKELLGLLFGPSWMKCPAFQVFSFLAEAENEEVLLFFRDKDVSSTTITSYGIRERYCKLLQSIETNLPERSWKVLSKAQRLSFFVDDSELVSDDETAVEQMKQFLIESGNTWDEVDKFGTTSVSFLFGKMCYQSVKRDWNKHPQDMKARCDENATAQKFREVFGFLLKTLLDTPMRESARRERCSRALKTMADQFEAGGWSTFRGTDALKALVAEFESELALLRGDANLTRSIVTAVGY